MARYISLGGLASLLVVDRDREIQSLLDQPLLDRDFSAAGPLVNRVLLARARRGVSHQGKVLLSFRPRDDEERRAAQRNLFERLDALASQKPWAPEAISAMATYAATGKGRRVALAALAYVTAYPFLEGGRAGDEVAFDPAKFDLLYRLYRVISLARRPLKGLLIRLAGLDKAASRRVLDLAEGDDYGLHALGVTIDNSRLILEQLRTAMSQQRPGQLMIDWSAVRTAPQLVLRQVKRSCALPGVPVLLAPGTLVLLHMRDGLRPDSDPGYEFASSHWSACPARKYIMSVFAAVSEDVAASLAIPQSEKV
jgi:hypothetical protein